MIRLENISFWDYTQKDNWALSDFVVGLFREAPAKDDSLILYVQLSQSADFSVEEVDGDLVIRLTPAAANTHRRCITVRPTRFLNIRKVHMARKPGNAAGAVLRRDE